MSDHTETLQARLTAAVVAGKDTTALRAEILQLEANELGAKAQAARDAAADKAAEIGRINAAAAELVDGIFAEAAISIEPIEDTNMTTDIPADLKALVEHQARLAAKAKAEAEKATDDTAAKKNTVAELADRGRQMQDEVDGLRALGASRPLDTSEGARLILLQMDLADLAGSRAAADREAADAGARMAVKSAELRKALADLNTCTLQARLELRRMQARRLESALVSALGELWADATAVNPRASWTATWQPGLELKRATVLCQPPVGGVA